MFTARYGLISYITQSRFVLKRLSKLEWEGVHNCPLSPFSICPIRIWHNASCVDYFIHNFCNMTSCSCLAVYRCLICLLCIVASFKLCCVYLLLVGRVYCCSCLVCVLFSYVYLLCYLCIAVFFFTLDAGLLARSQYSEGPATGHLDTGFSWFPCA